LVVCPKYWFKTRGFSRKCKSDWDRY